MSLKLKKSERRVNVRIDRTGDKELLSYRVSFGV